MGRRKRPERVLGPYRDRDWWRVVHVKGDGTRTTSTRETQAAALQFRADLEAEIQEVSSRTVGDALDAFETHQRNKRLKPRTIAEALPRLARFFPDRDLLLSSVTPARCRTQYTKLTAIMAVDTHRKALIEAKTFLKFCVGEGWLAKNPAGEVEGIGRRRKGKPQLRMDEAKRWSALVFRKAKAGEPGAIAALMTLYMDMRATEIVSVQARDVDDDGRVLWIPDSKTDAGKRMLEIPEPLRKPLMKLASGVRGDHPIFDRTRGWLWQQVTNLCDEAGVPRMGPHSMRGLHASIALEMGATSHMIALAMGHTSSAITMAAYAKPESQRRAKQGAVTDRLLSRRR